MKTLEDIKDNFFVRELVMPITLIVMAVGGTVGYLIIKAERKNAEFTQAYCQAVCIADTNKNGDTDKKELAEMYKKMNIPLVEGQHARKPITSELEKYILLNQPLSKGLQSEPTGVDLK